MEAAPHVAVGDMPLSEEDHEKRRGDSASLSVSGRRFSKFGKGTFRHPDPMVRFTFGVFLFTAVLASVGAIQAWAFIQSERALVVPVDARFAKWPIPTGRTPLEIIVRFKNIGRSAAKFENDVVSVADGLPDEPDFSHGRDMVMAPLAASTTQVVHAYFGEGVGSGFVSSLNDGSRQFYFFGRVRYTDDYSVFTKKETRFCFMFHPDRETEPHEFVPCVNPRYTRVR